MSCAVFPVILSKIDQVVSEITKPVRTAHFRLPKFSHQSNSLIYKKLNYRKPTEAFSTIFGSRIDRALGHVLSKYSLEITATRSKTKSIFECLLFKNFETDFLVFFGISVKEYGNYVCEMPKHSIVNCILAINKRLKLSILLLIHYLAYSIPVTQYFMCFNDIGVRISNIG